MGKRAGLVAACAGALALAACRPGTPDTSAAPVPDTSPAPAAGAVAATPPANAATVGPVISASPQRGTTTESHWHCGDQRIAARFDTATGTLNLIHERGQLALPRTDAASGARYADLNGNEFWDKADTAVLTLSGTPPRECAKVSGGLG